MKSKLIIAMAILLIAYPYILTRGNAAANAGAAGSPNSAQDISPFSADELDNLLAPIALYPDPLLAQLLPAATFVDQITQAAAWLRANNNSAQIDNQPWDPSVRAIAHFPDVLYKMSDYTDWTTALGQAFVDQQADVSASIQRLRQQARNSGALISTPQQTVAVQQGYVTIVPAQPNVVFVPQYNPAVVFGGPSYGALVASSLISFGAGFAVGSWWNRGWGWGGRGIYSNNFTNININRDVRNRNWNRNNMGRWNSVHRNTDWNRHGRPSGRPGAGGNLPSRPGGGRPGAPGTGIGGNRPGGGGRPGAPGTGIGGNRPGGGGRPGTPGAGTGGNRPGTGGTPGAGTGGNRPNIPGTSGRPGAGGRPGLPSTSGGRPSIPGRGGQNNLGGGGRGGGGRNSSRMSMGGSGRSGGGRSMGGGGHRGGGRSMGGGGHRGGGRRR